MCLADCRCKIRITIFQHRHELNKMLSCRRSKLPFFVLASLLLTGKFTLYRTETGTFYDKISSIFLVWGLTELTEGAVVIKSAWLA